MALCSPLGQLLDCDLDRSGGWPLAFRAAHIEPAVPGFDRNPVGNFRPVSISMGGRGVIHRTVRFFVPLFFYVPLLSRCCPTICPFACPGLIVLGLIFLIVTYSYNKPPCPTVCPDHCLGFQPGQKPVHSRFRPAPFLSQLTNRDTKLPTLQGDDSAIDVEFCGLPTGTRHQPEPRPEASNIAGEKRVLARFAVKGDEAAH